MNTPVVLSQVENHHAAAARHHDAVDDAAAQLRSRHTGLSQPYTLQPHPILQRQQQQESNARSYPRKLPLVLERAHGIFVQDISGQVFIDFLAGAGTLALGHNHPLVVEAIQNALASGLPMHTLDLSTPVKDAFVQELFDCLPASLAHNARIQFCGPSGADAVEAAMKLVRTATGRHTTLAFQGGYHGMTLGTLAISGNLGPKNALSGLLAGVQFLPFPNDYRCPFGLGGDAGIDANLNYLRQLLSDPESGVCLPAGLILEAIQGEGGVIPAPDRWLHGLRDITAHHQVPLIVDEIQAGIARSGKMFAFEHADITPDVITLSKAIGGGLPLSVVVYRGELDQWQPGAHAGTFRGNQLAMAAGTAVLRYIKHNNLAEHASRMGARLLTHLRCLADEFPWIGNVRGRGLMLGMEIVHTGAHSADADNGDADNGIHNPPPPADGTRARAYQQACLRRGLILELGGRHGAVVRLLPPLIVTETDIDWVAEILYQAGKDVDGGL